MKSRSSLRLSAIIASFGKSLSHIRLDYSKLAGENIRLLSLTEVDMQNSIMEGMVFDRVAFTKCNMTNLVATKCYFKECVFKECMMAGSIFVASSLQSSVIRPADGATAKQRKVQIVGCDITNIIMPGYEEWADVRDPVILPHIRQKVSLESPLEQVNKILGQGSISERDKTVVPTSVGSQYVIKKRRNKYTKAGNNTSITKRETRSGAIILENNSVYSSRSAPIIYKDATIGNTPSRLAAVCGFFGENFEEKAKKLVADFDNKHKRK